MMTYAEACMCCRQYKHMQCYRAASRSSHSALSIQMRVLHLLKTGVEALKAIFTYSVLRHVRCIKVPNEDVVPAEDRC
jgi:hypothetical protein